MANEKEAKKETKNKKSFFKDFKAELKKVIWPTPKQLVNNTVAVVVIVIITAAIVFVLDVAFDLFNKYGINNLKSKIRGYDTVQVEDEHNHENESAENTVTDGTDDNNVAEGTENTVEDGNETSTEENNSTENVSE